VNGILKWDFVVFVEAFCVTLHIRVYTLFLVATVLNFLLQTPLQISYTQSIQLHSTCTILHQIKLVHFLSHSVIEKSAHLRG